jgi:ribosomal protein S17
MPVKQQIGIVISNKMQKTIVVKLKIDIHIQFILKH